MQLIFSLCGFIIALAMKADNKRAASWGVILNSLFILVYFLYSIWGITLHKGADCYTILESMTSNRAQLLIGLLMKVINNII